MAFAEPFDIIDNDRGSGFDAAVVAIAGLDATDLGVGEALGLLLGARSSTSSRNELWLPFSASGCLSAPGLIGLLVDDLSRDVALAADRVDGHDRAFAGQHVE